MTWLDWLVVQVAVLFVLFAAFLHLLVKFSIVDSFRICSCSCKCLIFSLLCLLPVIDKVPGSVWYPALSVCVSFASNNSFCTGLYIGAEEFPFLFYGQVFLKYCETVWELQLVSVWRLWVFQLRHCIRYLINLPWKDWGCVDLAIGYVPRWCIRPKTVTHRYK